MHEVDPDLCGKLAALYRKLVDANMNRDAAAVDEAIELLEFDHQTWQMLMKKLAEGAAQEGPAHPNKNPISGAQQTAISSLPKSA